MDGRGPREAPVAEAVCGPPPKARLPLSSCSAVDTKFCSVSSTGVWGGNLLGCSRMDSVPAPCGDRRERHRGSSVGGGTSGWQLAPLHGSLRGTSHGDNRDVCPQQGRDLASPPFPSNLLRRGGATFPKETICPLRLPPGTAPAPPTPRGGGCGPPAPASALSAPPSSVGSSGCFRPSPSPEVPATSRPRPSPRSSDDSSLPLMVPPGSALRMSTAGFGVC